MNARRSLALWVIPALLLGATVLPFALFWGDLPSPMATHWSLSGTPDGSMAPGVLLAVLAGISIAIWGAITIAVRRSPTEAASFAAVLCFVGALMAALSWIAVLASRSQASWRDASEVGMLQVAIVLGAGLAGAALGWLVAGGGPGTTGSTAPLADGSDATLVWSGSRTSWPLVAVAIGLAIGAAILWSAVSLVLAVVAILVITFSTVTLTVGPAGAVVSLGWLGWPRWRVPRSDITGASVENVRPLAYGGWGYRMRPGVRAVVIAGGDGVRIHRGDRADLVVTVNDAERGAAAVANLASQPTA